MIKQVRRVWSDRTAQVVHWGCRHQDFSSLLARASIPPTRDIFQRTTCHYLTLRPRKQKKVFAHKIKSTTNTLLCKRSIQQLNISQTPSKPKVVPGGRLCEDFPLEHCRHPHRPGGPRARRTSAANRCQALRYAILAALVPGDRRATSNAVQASGTWLNTESGSRPRDLPSWLPRALPGSEPLFGKSYCEMLRGK